jgi:mannose-6-phosphate isomerase class I
VLVHSRLQGKCDDRDWTQCNDKRGIKRMIHEGKWSEFIREIPIKKGDFLQIDPGTVHAIKGGTLILET